MPQLKPPKKKARNTPSLLMLRPPTPPQALPPRAYQSQDEQEQELPTQIKTLEPRSEIRYHCEEVLRGQDPNLEELLQQYSPLQLKFTGPAPLALDAIQRKAAQEPSWVTPSSFCFNQDFSSGNLLRSFEVAPHKYDLYLRCDSNSRGHTNWFFFTAGPFRKN